MPWGHLHQFLDILMKIGNVAQVKEFYQQLINLLVNSDNWKAEVQSVLELVEPIGEYLDKVTDQSVWEFYAKRQAN